MNEINKPNNRRFWKATSAGVEHTGFTEPNQVTSTNHTLTDSENASDIYPELPTAGFLVEGDIYSYEGGMVVIVQSHDRTIYPPQLTPNLINFIRAEVGDLLWIENEQIEVGDIRIYEGIKYQALQAHTSLANWIPSETPTLWEVYQDSIPVWVQPTGAHDAYNIGDLVYFPTANDDIYKSLINGNTYSPLTYPAGWEKQ